MNHNFFKGINFENLFFEKVPENFKKSISDSLFIENKMSFHEELYTSTDDTENEIENIINNFNIDTKENNNKKILCGNDFCIIKCNDICFEDNYFML